MSTRARLVLVGAVLALALFAAPSSHAVVLGTQVPQGQRTFMAALLRNGSQFCGGSVVAPQAVVTAAHCVAGSSTAGLAVSVGHVDHTRGTVIPVAQVLVHPDYASAPSADVAVLRLASPVPSTVRPITLAGPGDDHLEQAGRPVVVAGWGSQMPLIGQLPPLDARLRQVTLDVVADGDLPCGTSAPADQVCAAALLRDSCQGDSGGPLFADLPSGEVQIGIVSSGLGCAVPLFAGLYTEVNGPRIASFLATAVP